MNNAGNDTRFTRREFMRTASAMLAALALPMIAWAADPAGTFDLVINNGRVMDPETRFDAVANVGIKDGRIAAITTNKIEGKETIDASGHVVAPGFIDTHWHYDRPWSNKLALRDGRTSVMDLEFGTHGPFIDQWYQEREGNNQVNFGQAVAHELARAAVLDGFTGGQDVRTAADSRAAGDGWCCRRPSLGEGNKILQLLDEGLVAGGLGVGSTLGYMRDGVSPREFSSCNGWPGSMAARPARTSATRPAPIPPSLTASRSCWPTRRPWARPRWPAISTTPATIWSTSCWCGCAGAA